MRYTYCKMHDTRHDKLPEGCQYQIASGKWMKEEWPPHQWGGLLRRWPVVVVVVAAKKEKKQKKRSKAVVYAYYTKDFEYTRPDKLPEGCEVEDAFDGGWDKETMSPGQWGGLRRRWPKPEGAEVTVAKPKPKAKVVYTYWNPGDPKPRTMPKACKVMKEDGKWHDAFDLPSEWCSMRRRWPKPVVVATAAAAAAVVKVPPKEIHLSDNMHVYIRKDRVTGIVNQIKDLLKQLE